jgi:hypothetical protein
MTHVHVFKIDTKNSVELKKVLDADPFADDSFVKAGYVLKESQALGFPAGSQILYFRVEDAAVGAKLLERLKAIPSAQELSGPEKVKVEHDIEEEQAAAATGFGSIFGE